MSTFHPFPRLPAELRIAIWEFTVEPREVEVRVVNPTRDDPLIPKWSSPVDWQHISLARFNEAMSHLPISTRTGSRGWSEERKKALRKWKGYHPYVHLTSSTTPAILQTCREARNLGLYQQIYLDGDDPPQSGRRYIWLILDIDMINIGTWDMIYFTPIARSIKRLKLSRKFPGEWESGMDLISAFVNVKELHIVCMDGLEFWDDDTDVVRWPCAKENLTYIDETPHLYVSEVGQVQVGYHEMIRLCHKFWSTPKPAYDNEYLRNEYLRHGHCI